MYFFMGDNLFSMYFWNFLFNLFILFIYIFILIGTRIYLIIEFKL